MCSFEIGEIGERIRRYRRSKKWSQKKLSMISGVSSTYIGEVERGEKNPTILTLKKLGQALEIPIENFVKDE